MIDSVIILLSPETLRSVLCRGSADLLPGNRIGTLCVADRIARDLSQEQEFALLVLSRQIIRQMEAKRINKKLADMSETQHRFLNLLLKDVKSPLSSVGTLLNLLQDHVEHKDQLLGFTKMASSQFNTSLNQLSNLSEWNRICLQNGGAVRAGAGVNTFVETLFKDLRRDDFAENYSFHNQLSTAFFNLRYSEAVYFIIRNLICWLCGCARDGDVFFNRFSDEGGVITIKVHLCSNSISDDINCRITQAHEQAIWPEKNDTPVGELQLALAKDMTEKLNGTITVYLREKTEVHLDLIIP